IDEFTQKDFIVKQQIFSTVTDRMLLRVGKFDTASEAWIEVCSTHEGKTEMMQVDICRRMQEMRCGEKSDVKAHCAELLRLCELLAGMGASIGDQDFHAMILASLPASYRPLLSSISAVSKIMQRPFTSTQLIDQVTEEYEHQLIVDREGK
ncbi:hypothetical protein BV22DRAFT_987644, partial [Leucogyrophana mollusca]